MTYPRDEYAFLPSPGVIPNPVNDNDDFMRWMYSFYYILQEGINQRKPPHFSMEITDTFQNVPFEPSHGSFIILVGGEASDLPSEIFDYCKSDDTVAGTAGTLQFQQGTNAWAATQLFINATTSGFQIRHNNTGVRARFHIRIIGSNTYEP